MNLKKDNLFDENIKVKIPDELKTIFLSVPQYIQKNIYENKGHAYDLQKFTVRYFKNKSNTNYYIHHLRYKREFYTDCKDFFLLFYRDLPVAIISFYIMKKVIYIKQIQGIRDVNKENKKSMNFHISFFYWQKVLVKYVEMYFGFIGFKEIRIQKAKNNYWLKTTMNSRELLNRFKINYDKVAFDMGYKSKFFGKYFYKKL